MTHAEGVDARTGEIALELRRLMHRASLRAASRCRIFVNVRVAQPRQKPAAPHRARALPYAAPRGGTPLPRQASSRVCPVGAVSIDDEAVLALVYGACKGAEDGNLLGARERRRSSASSARPAVVETGAGRLQHLLGVGACLGKRVDAAHRQTPSTLIRRAPPPHAPRDRSWSGAPDDHARQLDGDADGDGGLANAALAHGHDHPMRPAAANAGTSAASGVVGGVSGVVSTTPCRAEGGDAADAAPRAKSCPQRGEADEPEGQQRQLGARHRTKTHGHGLLRVGASPGHRHRDGVVRVGRVEDAVEHEGLSRHAERGELGAGALGLAQRRRVGPRHEHERRTRAIDQRRAGGVVERPAAP
jgi:hypothetical protein